MKPNFDFTTCRQADLSFQAGDAVTVFGEPDDQGFYFCEREYDGRRGYVPASHFRSDPSPSPPQNLPPSASSGTGNSYLRGNSAGSRGGSRSHSHDPTNRSQGYDVTRSAQSHDVSASPRLQGHDALGANRLQGYDVVNSRSSQGYEAANSRSSQGYDVTNSRSSQGYDITNSRSSQGYDVANSRSSQGHDGKTANRTQNYDPSPNRSQNYDSVGNRPMGQSTGGAIPSRTHQGGQRLPGENASSSGGGPRIDEARGVERGSVRQQGDLLAGATGDHGGARSTSNNVGGRTGGGEHRSGQSGGLGANAGVGGDLGRSNARPSPASVGQTTAVVEQKRHRP